MRKFFLTVLLGGCCCWRRDRSGEFLMDHWQRCGSCDSFFSEFFAIFFFFVVELMGNMGEFSWMRFCWKFSKDSKKNFFFRNF